MEDVLKLHLELIVEIPSKWFVGSASYMELEHLNMRFSLLILKYQPGLVYKARDTAEHGFLTPLLMCSHFNIIETERA